MSVTFNKPAGMHYTEMCMYIDAHMQETIVSNQHPEVEQKIYEYLYHVLYALACKSAYFQKFEDYDGYACYGAAELFISMRNKWIRAGREVRGKTIMPVKSSLNFIKAVMYALKINYQRDNFTVILNPTINDTSQLGYDMKENIQVTYRTELVESFKAAISEVPDYIKKIIKHSPFRNDPLMCKKLYLSAVLTFLDSITLPNRLKNKIIAKDGETNPERAVQKFTNAYKSNDFKVIKWHIDEPIDNYISLLVIRAKKEFSKTLNFYIHSTDLSDELLDNIMKSAYSTYTDRGDIE